MYSRNAELNPERAGQVDRRFHEVTDIVSAVHDSVSEFTEAAQTMASPRRRATHR